MKVAFTERFLRDFQESPGPLARKCRELIGELQRIEPSALRQQALPGWRLHRLSGSNMVSLSVDMNFRILAELERDTLILHRFVKHDSADRATLNRNDRAEAIAQMSMGELLPSGVYDALRSFGVSATEAERFRTSTTEDDLLNAAADVSTATANLALALYETSALVIPRARFRVLHKDEDFARILESGGSEWEMYLHPSQRFIVELPVDFRAAVMGSAGTGKTVCAWYRAKHIIAGDKSVGFVGPNKSVLEISKDRLMAAAGPAAERSFVFVPRHADELVQLAARVDHIIVDEAQEIPVTWLRELSATISENAGVTLFYDINQLGGNIPNGDLSRYRVRISDWKKMLSSFPRMQKLSLTINYRNAREIADYYIAALSDALPAKPSADVPTFETGEVIRRKVRHQDVDDAVASLIRRLLQDHVARDIGVVALDRGPDKLRSYLAGRHLPVTDDPAHDAVAVTSASIIRGHERRVIIVTTKSSDSSPLKIGRAVDAYVAMSRAVKQLFVIEVDG